MLTLISDICGVRWQLISLHKTEYSKQSEEEDAKWFCQSGRH